MLRCFVMTTMNLKASSFKTKKWCPYLKPTQKWFLLLQIGVPVFLILCEDANGQSEIAAVCLLVTKDGESLKWMIKAFKKLNSKWCDIRTVMADKDLNERDAVKESLPQATMLICMFDTLRTFRREITWKVRHNFRPTDIGLGHTSKDLLCKIWGGVSKFMQPVRKRWSGASYYLFQG